jgi:arsenite-transporting ATPase
VSALDDLIDALPRITLVVGKGGVGKTTCATGIAAAAAARGERTLLVSTDPAAALADVAGAPVGTGETPVSGYDELMARQLSASELRREFLDKWRRVIAEIVDRGTYLARHEVDGLVDAALPGGDEIFALLALAELFALVPARYDRIVVDTAPTGHTLRLLELAGTFRALVAMLDLMQDKHRFMVRALAHRYRRDEADQFLDDMRARVEGLQTALADGTRLAAVLVTRLEPIVIAETRRYLDALCALDAAAVDWRGAARSIDSAVPRFALPRAASPPRGIGEIHQLFSRLDADGARAPAALATDRAGLRPHGYSAASPPFDLHELTRPFTIVGGKGGVGKSTVACALAIAAADRREGAVLLVSTDPAPSIADALGETYASWARADEEHAVDAAPGLVARQMDATAAFAKLRDRYQERIDEVFDVVVRRGVDVSRDRAVLRELLALAPPGIDELFALSILGDALADRQFETVVVDPAPTGHLLRLLEMPDLALDWTHRLMRLMLEYRNVIALGDTARELLEFSKRTRAIDQLLRDPARCGLVIVALDEPVVRSETERLAGAARARGVGVIGVIWNRVGASAPAPLPTTVARRQVCARATSPPPVGGTALREWSHSWRELDSLSHSST